MAGKEFRQLRVGTTYQPVSECAIYYIFAGITLIIKQQSHGQLGDKHLSTTWKSMQYLKDELTVHTLRKDRLEFNTPSSQFNLKFFDKLYNIRGNYLTMAK